MTHSILCDTTVRYEKIVVMKKPEFDRKIRQEFFTSRQSQNSWLPFYLMSYTKFI